MRPCQGLVESSILSGRTYDRPKHANVSVVVVCSGQRESKDGAGTQDEWNECLSASRGREHLAESKQSEDYA